MNTALVRHVGPIWQPGFVCAMDYRVKVDDLRDDRGVVTRDSVQNWLDTHAGDFSGTMDFAVEPIDNPFAIQSIGFATDEGEMAYCTAMYGEEE